MTSTVDTAADRKTEVGCLPANKQKKKTHKKKTTFLENIGYRFRLNCAIISLGPDDDSLEGHSQVIKVK